MGAGDIATCGGQGDEATAALLDGLAGTIFTTGDNVYDSGTPNEFAQCFEPSWGRHKARILPSPGNHDYGTGDAAGYFAYFGGIGAPGGYYAYDAGAWRVYSLNSEIISQAQLDWLAADLAGNPRLCALAYFHHPRFSSGNHGSDSAIQPLWATLDAAGADVVINGHDHDYERFAPMNAAGNADPAGMRQFVVGTGGAEIRGFPNNAPNSEVRNSDTFGVLQMTLTGSDYSWAFIPAAGGSFTDSGSGTCN